MPAPAKRLLTRPRTLLRVTELERRDTPAWWSVTGPKPPEGTAGSTDATLSGQLLFSPDYTPAAGVVTVFADTPAAAVAQALAGSVEVSLNGETWSHPFGPGTVSADPAAHTPFLAVVSGTSVSLAVEDMAGRSGCDYDYNDRTWAGVSVTSAADPVVPLPVDQWTWVHPTSGSARVHLKVTRPTEDTYHWDYTVTNLSLHQQFTSPGINQFVLSPQDISGASKMKTNLGSGWSAGVGNGMLMWRAHCVDGGPYLGKGQSGHFEFDTPRVPITNAHGGVGVAGYRGGVGAASAKTGGWDMASADGGPEPCPMVDEACGGDTLGPDVPPTIIITDGQSNVATDLRVAKWHDAFEADGASKPKVKGPLAGSKRDFIDRDDDRFNLWVYDKIAWDAGKSFVDAKISTSNATSFTDYNDLETAQRLVRYTTTDSAPGSKATGWFWSDSQLLVSNKVDDEYSDTQYLGVDESGPGEPYTYKKNGFTFAIGDRTHRIALGGAVRATYPMAKDATASVKVSYTGKLNINILKVTENGEATATAERVERDVKSLNEIFTQVGIRFTREIRAAV